MNNSSFRIDKMIKANRKLIISSILFLFVFCFLGLPFTHWWFNGDDFSALAIGKNMQTWSSFWSHVIEGNVSKYFYPSHHAYFTPYGAATTHQLNFFEVYYRPIHCAYFSFAYWLFGFNAYAYYLVSVFLHALNTALLFNMLRWFSGYLSALFFALLFALHPQIGFRFGAPANFQYYLNVLLLLLTIITLKSFLERRKYFYLFLSAMLFTMALLTRETAIVFPAILFVGTWLYQKKISWTPIAHGFAAIGYLALRTWLYPFNTMLQGDAGGNGLLYKINISLIFTLFSKITTRFNEILVCIYDSLSLSWLPYGHKWLRLSLVLVAALLIGILFFRNKHKFLIIFLGVSYVLMLWPSVLGAYSPRYFYEASPILMFFFAVLWNQKTTHVHIKKIIIFLCSSLICLYAFFAFTNLKCRETKLFTIKQAFLALSNDQRVTSGTHPLCFLAFPIDGFGTGIEQAAWLFLIPPTNPVYYDPSTMLTQNDSNILENAGWYMRCATYFNKNYFTIAHTKNGIQLTSTNSQKIHFSKPGDYLSLGAKTVHQSDFVEGQNVVTNFTLTLDRRYLEPKPIIITWDYEKQQFIVYE